MGWIHTTLLSQEGGPTGGSLSCWSSEKSSPAGQRSDEMCKKSPTLKEIQLVFSSIFNSEPVVGGWTPTLWVRGGVWISKVQLGGALGDQHGGGGIQGVRDGVLQEHRGAGLHALSVPLLPLSALAQTLATNTIAFNPDYNGHLCKYCMSFYLSTSSCQDNPSLPATARLYSSPPHLSPPRHFTHTNSLTSIFIKKRNPFSKGNGNLCFIDVCWRRQFNLHSKPQIGPFCCS